MIGSYSVTVIDTLRGWAGIGKNWDDLLTESGSNAIFLTWEWLYTWAECFLGADRQLFILAVYKGDDLFGVAPWCIHDTRCLGLLKRQIEFLGAPETGSDYLDVFIKRGKEKEVTRCIYRFLFHEASALWDGLALHEIPSESLFLLHFLTQIAEEGKYAELQAGSFSPCVGLPQSRGPFLDHLSPNRRQQFRRHYRILQRRGNVTHHSVRSENVTLVLKDCRRIYEQRWHKADAVFSFLEKVISRSEGKDWIEVDLLDVSGENIASLVHLRYENTLSMYLMAVDHSFDKSISIGNILVWLAIERGISEGISAYDFLKGSEDYKFHWADSGRRCLNLLFYRPRFMPIVGLAGSCCKSMAKALLR